MPDNKDYIYLDFNPDGTVTCPWVTKDAKKLLDNLGTSAPGYEEVDKNPWCG